MRAGESLQAATSKGMTDSAAKHDALQRYIPEDAKGKSKGKGMEVFAKGSGKHKGARPSPYPPAAGQARPVCRLWQQGHCRFGERCKFLRVTEQDRQPEVNVQPVASPSTGHGG